MSACSRALPFSSTTYAPKSLSVFTGSPSGVAKVEPSGYCSTFYRLRLLSSERISSCPKRFRCADIWTIFEDLSFLIFSKEPNIFKDYLGRDAWNLRVLATNLFWINVLNAALPTASAFKISFATSSWAHAPEEMQNRSSLTTTSNGFMKLWKAVISV